MKKQKTDLGDSILRLESHLKARVGIKVLDNDSAQIFETIKNVIMGPRVPHYNRDDIKKSIRLMKKIKKIDSVKERLRMLDTLLRLGSITFMRLVFTSHE